MSLTVELIIRRGTDGAVITRVAGDACQPLEWQAPAGGSLVESLEPVRLLTGFTYKPTLAEKEKTAHARP